MSTFLSRSRTTVVLALLATAVPTTSEADSIIYSTLGPGDSYDGTSSYIVSLAGSYSTAFVPDMDYYLTTIEVPVFGGISWSARVRLFEDDGLGEPGVLLEELFIGALGGGELFSRTSVHNPLLASGTQYWLQVTPTLGSPALNHAFWRRNSAGYTGLIWGLGYNPPREDVAPAFRVSGTEVNPAVPEPATALLVCAGLAGIMASRRKTKRQRALKF